MSDPALAQSLASRVRLFTRLAGVGFTAWQGGEAWLALSGGGPGFVLSGIGMSLTIVSVILLLGSSLHARKAKAFDVFSDPMVGKAARTGLMALGLAMAIAAGLIGLFETPQSPLIDLIIAAPVLGFCLHFAQGFNPHSD